MFSCLLNRRIIKKRKQNEKVKKRILSFIVSLGILCGVFGSAVIESKALEIEQKKVDGSYLTMDDSSSGISSNNLTRGKHMMTGECSISKAGTKRIYTFGATTANHDVDYLAVIVYVDRYHEDTQDWGQIDWFVQEDENDYFVYTSKSITVERGYYYRVHADHFVQEGEDPIEETYSYTDGIWVP